MRNKLGNIVAETLFPVMFLGWLNWKTYVADANFASVKQNVFELIKKHFLAPRMRKFISATMFLARLNWETFASAAIFQQQCFPA